MKILCAEYNAAAKVAVVPVGDDVLLRNNGDFYIPEYSCRVSAVPQLVVRLCKLGKSVGERFANRYYQEVGVGIRFYADELEEELRQKGLPPVVASSFDGSAAISQLVEWRPEAPLVYEMKVNEETVFRGDKAGMPVCADRLVALASDFHTLKIGDFLFCGNLFRYRDLHEGDRLRMTLDGVLLLDFRIR